MIRNLNEEIEIIGNFIKRKLHEANANKIIIGLSGGIDSAVVAALSVKAIGKENVIGVMLPYKKSHPNSFNHAVEVAKTFEIQYSKIDISPMVDSYFDLYDSNADELRRGNRMARERMCILYDLSAKHNGLVIGTGNKSELFIGYFTQYGDGACAFEPIGHLYKTEVFEIAKILKVPNSVIEKRPTADLWEAQTDEDEMGITYKVLDQILYCILDLNNNDTEIHDKGFSYDQIDLVKKMISRSEFKRHLPEVLSN